MRILYLDATVRPDSRTAALAQTVLSRLDGDVTFVKLCEQSFPVMDGAFVAMRNQCAAAKRFEAPLFDHAKTFASADVIVIAAPYWDLSFPASLKQYFEQINVIGLTFAYTEQGEPYGLCKAKKLYYVTTAGGVNAPDDYGFAYVKALADRFYGIPECVLYKAEGLDLVGADPEAILSAVKQKILQDLPLPQKQQTAAAAPARDARVIDCPDDNITQLRARYPDGLHFVVGDTHGAGLTLQNLLRKICFDPAKDHVYFVGDYNGGGNVQALMKVLAEHYEADYSKPGFHLIRGNHERWCGPYYPLENLPDILVVRGKVMNYFIVHAGMLANAFDLIRQDMAAHPEQEVFAYRLSYECVQAKDSVLYELLWSRSGLYDKKNQGIRWAAKSALDPERACILHGHAPFSYFKHGDVFSYGGYDHPTNLYWANQHIWFCEEMHSFNLDSDIKGKNKHGETYRGLTALCLEVCGEAAAQNGGILTADGIRKAENCAFGVPLDITHMPYENCDLSRILNARPEMKTITLDANHHLKIC